MLTLKIYKFVKNKLIEKKLIVHYYQKCGELLPTYTNPFVTI